MCVLNRGKQKDYRWDRKQGSDVYCWFVHNSGKGFVDGHYTNYIVPTLDSFLPLPSVWVCVCVLALKQWPGSVGVRHFQAEEGKLGKKIYLKMALFNRTVQKKHKDKLAALIEFLKFTEKHNLPWTVQCTPSMQVSIPLFKSKCNPFIYIYSVFTNQVFGNYRQSWLYRIKWKNTLPCHRKFFLLLVANGRFKCSVQKKKKKLQECVCICVCVCPL